MMEALRWRVDFKAETGSRRGYDSALTFSVNVRPGSLERPVNSVADVKSVLYIEHMYTKSHFDVDVGVCLARPAGSARGLSQRALAKRAGVSNATVSMVEANRISPSVSGLRQILSGIPISLGEFFAAPAENREQVVFRADELREIAGGPISFRQVGSNLDGRSLQMIHERYRPGAESGKAMLTHQGEEAGLVIRGRMQLEVAGARYELGPGDAHFFGQPQAACLPQYRRRRARTGFGLHAVEFLRLPFTSPWRERSTRLRRARRVRVYGPSGDSTPSPGAAVRPLPMER